MSETYIVTIDYLKEDGYWKIGHKETITLNKNGKCNHKRAEKLVQAKFPGCRVKRVDFS